MNPDSPMTDHDVVENSSEPTAQEVSEQLSGRIDELLEQDLTGAEEAQMLEQAYETINDVLDQL